MKKIILLLFLIVPLFAQNDSWNKWDSRTSQDGATIVLWLKGDNVTVTDDTNATIWPDVSGHGNNVTLQNNPQWDVDSSSVTFDGIDDRGVILSANLKGTLGTLTDFTMIIYAKWVSLDFYIMRLINPTDGWRWRYDDDTNDVRILIRKNPDSNEADSGGLVTIENGNYHTIGIIYNDATGAIDYYLDGALSPGSDVSANQLGVADSENFWFMCNTDASYHTNAKVKEVRVYDVVKTESEMYDIHDEIIVSY